MRLPTLYPERYTPDVPPELLPCSTAVWRQRHAANKRCRGWAAALYPLSTGGGGGWINCRRYATGGGGRYPFDPSALHLCCRMLADLVTGLIERTTEGLLLGKPLRPDEEARAAAPLPAPLLPVHPSL